MPGSRHRKTSAGLFLSVKQVPTARHMAQILFYIIPCDGIFLSFFFLVRSERPPGSNFLLGSMLLALSCLSALQYFLTLTANPSQPLDAHYILNELLISPFLFLYTFTILHPSRKSNIWLHMLFIMTNLPLLFWVNRSNSLLINLIINAFNLMNGMYLFASIFMILDSSKGKSGETGEFPAPAYKWIYLLNLMVIGTSSFSIMSYALCPARMACLAQIAKGLVIYFTYIKLLDKAVFNGFPHP